VIETATGDRGSLLDGSTSTVNNQGTVDVTNNAYLTIDGAMNNTGTFGLLSGGNDTRLRIGTGGATLSGGGTIVLSDNTNNAIDGAVAGVTLTNTNNTIEGAGDIGLASGLTFVNQASGIVDASAANNALVIDFGSKVVANQGLFESTNTGGLRILSSTVDNRSSTGGGTIEANGGNVVLAGPDILGGLLTTVTKGGGVIETGVNDRGSVLDGSTKLGTTAKPVLLLGTCDITNNAYLTIDGTINLSQTVGKVTTTGTIALQSGGNDTRLVVGAKSATLGKGGFVTMTDNPNNSIVGTKTGSGKTAKDSKLTNNATISGAGNIGSELILTNASTIDATGANALILQTGDPGIAKSNIVSNTGTIESTNPNSLVSTGGLRISSTIVTGKRSIVEANGTATHVDLQSATPASTCKAAATTRGCGSARAAPR
jgi:hypothetical protein